MVHYIRDNKGSLVGFEYNKELYHYVLNVFGDVIKILDEDFNTVASYQYDSWGKILSIKDANGNEVINDLTHIENINPFRYRSYYYDVETNLYYLNSRYYNPEIGRFINADVYVSTGQGMLGHNMYIYCNNNPITYNDSNAFFSSYAIMGVGFVSVGFSNIINKKVTSVTIKKAENKNELPKVSEPNSTLTNPNGNVRKYGPDGRATTDIDYSHPNHHPELPNPHAHDWTWDEDGNASRGPAYDPSEIEFISDGIAVLGTGYLIYRFVRTLPSLMSGFWWTLPINFVTP